MSEVWKPYREDGIIPKDIYKAKVVKSEVNFSNDIIILYGTKYIVRLDAGKTYYKIQDRQLLFSEKFFNQKEVKYWLKNSFEEVIYSIFDGSLIPYLQEVGNGAWLYENRQKHLIIIATNIVIELIETEYITITIEERLHS